LQHYPFSKGKQGKGRIRRGKGWAGKRLVPEERENAGVKKRDLGYYARTQRGDQRPFWRGGGRHALTFWSPRGKGQSEERKKGLVTWIIACLKVATGFNERPPNWFSYGEGKNNKDFETGEGNARAICLKVESTPF